MKTSKLLLITSMLIFGQNYLFCQEKWQYLDGLSDQYLWKVHAQSPDTVYITGASSRYDGQGMIAKSINGGTNWIKTFTTTNNLVKDIAFYDKNTGFIVGENGVIMKTTNAGTDWQQKVSGTTQTLNAIALTGLDNIWAVGNTGIVLNSTDEGETWQLKDFDITDNLNDIKFYGTEGYLVGGNRSFYKTTDAGENWDKELISIDENALFNIQKTLNNLYVTAGDASRPYASYKKNNTGNWVVLSGGTGLCMINDGTGYSLDAGILTNGGENIITLNRIENNIVVSEHTIFRSWTSYIDDTHSGIFVSNDTMLYVLSGNVLLKSSPDITDKVEKSLRDFETLIIQNNLNGSLTLKIDDPVIGYELINTYGYILLSETLHSVITETTIDISNMPKGIYIVRAIFADKAPTVYKWIKH